MQESKSRAVTEKKEQLNKFVHDVASMEIQVFTLREGAERCRKDADRMEKSNTSQLEKAEKNLNSIQEIYQSCSNYHEANNTFIKYRKYNFSITIFLKEFFAFLLLYGLVGFIAGTLLSSLLCTLLFFEPWGVAFDSIYFTPVLIVVMVFLFVLYQYFFLYCYRGAEYRTERSASLNSLKKAEENLENAKKALHDAELNQTQTKRTASILRARGKEMETSAIVVEDSLKRCYAMDVVPISYRNLVCAVLLDEIFQNDKADTMREAILLCDVELRHAQLIGKLHDIYYALESLASGILEMETVLEGIRTNVSRLQKEVCELGESQKQLVYASEAMQSSAENLDFYLAQRRVGAL